VASSDPALVSDTQRAMVVERLTNLPLGLLD